MRTEFLTKLVERFLNSIELMVIILVLFIAFAYQIILHELPCPLCLLQRVGFFLVAFGFLMNLRFGIKPIHYSMVILAALFTAFVAMRQIAIHIVPGTGAYGSPIFGLHLYTWSFFIAMGIVIVTTLIMSLDRNHPKSGMHWPYLTHTLFVVVSALVILNIVSVFLECGLKQCPDNPIRYELLQISQ